MTICRASLLFLLALLVCTQASTPASGQIASATVRSAPRIYLSEPLTASSPQEFAKKLSALVGATIELPRQAQVVLRMPAGSYSADGLLMETAKQLSNQLGVGVKWHRSFILAHPDANKATAAFRLSSAGEVSYDCTGAAFGDAAKALADKAHCGVEAPPDIPGKFSLHVAQAPAESAMSRLAAQAGLVSTVHVIYELGKSQPGAILASDESQPGDSDQGDDAGENDNAALSADSPVDLDRPGDPNVSDADIANLSAWALEEANLPDGADGMSFTDWLGNSAYGTGVSSSDSGQ